MFLPVAEVYPTLNGPLYLGRIENWSRNSFCQSCASCPIGSC